MVSGPISESLVVLVQALALLAGMLFAGGVMLGLYVLIRGLVAGRGRAGVARSRPRRYG